MIVIANYSERDVRLYKIPGEHHSEIREAYERAEWLWLIKRWNEHEVTHVRLCSTCPDSIRVVKAFTPLLWQESTSTK